MKKIILFDIDHVLFDTEKFKTSKLTEYSLYNEVFDVLGSLSKIAELGIFSKGELEFQKAKLKNTKIESFFKEENVHIFQDKIANANILNKYRDYEVFFVDDRLDVLLDIKKTLPSVLAIWIRRGPHAEGLQKIEGFIPDEIILSLQELKTLTA